MKNRIISLEFRELLILTGINRNTETIIKQVANLGI